jgi:acyl-coenzyme A thioesterase PaaI-like protein
MSQKKHLIYDATLEVSKPYPGDKQGAFLLASSQLEMVLLKSNHQHELYAEVWFSSSTAGPPGHVHGGCQAAVLDEMMGSTGWHHGYGVVAAKIDVSFMEMVPFLRQYSLRGRITSIDKRKIFIEAELFDHEKVYAKSTGLFIVLKKEQIDSLGMKN